LKFLTFALSFKSLASLWRVIKLFLTGQAAFAPSGSVGLVVLAVDELLNLVLDALLAFGLLKPDMHVHQIADFVLLGTGVDMPIFNLVAAMVLPGFVQQKNFLAFHAFVSGVAGFCLPPAHLLMHFFLSSPVYMWVHCFNIA